jgi:hypothetical protein
VKGPPGPNGQDKDPPSAVNRLAMGDGRSGHDFVNGFRAVRLWLGRWRPFTPLSADASARDGEASVACSPGFTVGLLDLPSRATSASQARRQPFHREQPRRRSHAGRPSIEGSVVVTVWKATLPLIAPSSSLSSSSVVARSKPIPIGTASPSRNEPLHVLRLEHLEHRAHLGHALLFEPSARHGHDLAANALPYGLAHPDPLEVHP